MIENEVAPPLQITRRQLLVASSLALTAASVTGSERKPSTSLIELAPETQGLPPEVQKYTASTVFLRYATSHGIEENFSGFCLDSRYILSAGHAFRHPDNSLLYRKCHNKISYQGRTLENKVVTGDISYSFSSIAPDIALLEASTPIEGLLPVRTTNKPLQPNDRVFFINYEPMPNQRRRFASAANPAHRQPNAYEGKVIGVHSDKNISVVTYQDHNESDGIIDFESRAGGSGGLVVNSEGFAVGMLVQVSTKPVPLSRLEEIFNVSFPREYTARQVKPSIILPVSSEMLQKVVQRVSQSSDSCH